MRAREGIKISARPAETPEAAGEKKALKGPSALKRALGDARAVLPWRDPGKPARMRLMLYVALTPLWALLLPKLIETLFAGDANVPVTTVTAVSLLLLVLGPLLAPAGATFAVSLLFHALQGEDVNSRLRQALVCPYCRDSVGREGTVICARTKCGALYHRECWEECARQYGGCAVYGCTAKKCREVTAAGFALRLAKLLLAAALFPPRAVRALRSNETESALSVYRRAVAASKRVYLWTNANGRRQQMIVLLAGIPLSYLVLAALGFFRVQYRDDLNFPVFFAVVFSVPFFMLALPYLVAIPVVFTFFFALAMKRALEAEFSALERADQGGGTVLGRLRLGLGAKKA
jgi:hypothetical protein